MWTYTRLNISEKSIQIKLNSISEKREREREGVKIKLLFNNIEFDAMCVLEIKAKLFGELHIECELRWKEWNIISNIQFPNKLWDTRSAVLWNSFSVLQFFNVCAQSDWMKLVKLPSTVLLCVCDTNVFTVCFQWGSLAYDGARAYSSRIPNKMLLLTIVYLSQWYLNK